ncbi:transposase [Cytobacillus firmus]|uniref:transposase n=1 Tax=Cytobacillus firmus TaxID=1399 RepID=UPI0036A99285
MPRVSRKKSSSGIYHIMLRGINRQTIFEEKEDRLKFLEVLSKYKNKGNFHLYGYCLMDNHIHLLVKESEEESISTSIKRISSSYVYWYNLKYERCGHLFQERFKSEIIDSQAVFLKVLRYIHQNPLKAGLTKDVLRSQWTSIREYIQKEEMVDTAMALNLFSLDRRTAMKRFIEHSRQRNDDRCLDLNNKKRLSDAEIMEQIRKIGLENTSVLQQMEKGDRDIFLSKLKELDGVSLRQLSRITGISKSVIHRVRQ